MEAQANKNDNFFAYREGFISTEVDEMFAGSDENKNNGGGASEGGRMSYVFKLGYSYDNRYLFDFVGRIDGSAKFYKDNRWGFFLVFLLHGESAKNLSLRKNLQM